MANESLFNPSKPDQTQKIIMDVGNPKYWVTRAIEKILETNSFTEGSIAYHNSLKEAVTLLILTRAKLNEKAKKQPKAGKRVARPDSSDAKTP